VSSDRRNATLEDLDRARIIHPYVSFGAQTRTPTTIIEKADGIDVTFTNGNTYIDCMSSMNCVNVGYGRKEIAEAICRQAHDVAYYHSFIGVSNEPQIRLADRLLSGLLPSHMSKILFASSGSEAVDAALKFIWLYNWLRGKPEKRKIISRDQAYHGVTLGAASLAGYEAMQKGFHLPLPGFLRTENPHFYRNAQPGESEEDYSRRCARLLDELILAEGPETIAAFVCEPALGAGCAVMPPKGYFAEIQKVLKRHDVLFFDDECITGFGRTGRWFACETFGITPDIMTLSKGITSAYVPLSATVISETIWDVLDAGIPSEEFPLFASGSTASGHPIACAAANANIDIMEREDLIGNSRRVGAFFKNRLRELIGEHPLIGEIRGEGLMIGLELVADREMKLELDPAWDCSHRLVELCRQRGLITRSFFGTTSMSFGPPLILTEAQAEDIVRRVKGALDQLTAELVSSGRWAPRSGRAT